MSTTITITSDSSVRRLGPLAPLPGWTSTPAVTSGPSPYQFLSLTNITSTPEYEDVLGSVVNVIGNYSCVTYQVTELTGSAGVTCKMEGSVDGTIWQDLKSLNQANTLSSSVDVSIASGTTGYLIQTKTSPTAASPPFGFQYYKLLLSDTVASSHGIVNIKVLVK